MLEELTDEAIEAERKRVERVLKSLQPGAKYNLGGKALGKRMFVEELETKLTLLKNPKLYRKLMDRKSMRKVDVEPYGHLGGNDDY